MCHKQKISNQTNEKKNIIDSYKLIRLTLPRHVRAPNRTSLADVSGLKRGCILATVVVFVFIGRRPCRRERFGIGSLLPLSELFRALLVGCIQGFFFGSFVGKCSLLIRWPRKLRSNLNGKKLSGWRYKTGQFKRHLHRANRKQKTPFLELWIVGVNWKVIVQEKDCGRLWRVSWKGKTIQRMFHCFRGLNFVLDDRKFLQNNIAKFKTYKNKMYF